MKSPRNPRWANVFAALLATVALACCTESPQSAIDYPAVAVNDGPSLIAVGDWTVALSRADLAFGPVYFCAAASGSSTLCASAAAEITRVSYVDGLSRHPTSLGTVHGFTGPIQSAAYDFGISWFETTFQPTVAPEAPLGHSMRIEAEAQRGAQRLRLTVNVDLVPQYQGQRAVPTAAASAMVTESTERLEVHFDAARWLGQLDLDALASQGADPVVIDPGTPAHSEVLLGIKNIAQPAFRWVSRSQ